MEINLNTNVDSVSRASGFSVRGRETSAPVDAVSFQSSEALNRAMSATPEVRSDVVKRAQEMVLGTVPYPPVETVAKISHLLALGLDQQD